MLAATLAGCSASYTNPFPVEHVALEPVDVVFQEEPAEAPLWFRNSLGQGLSVGVVALFPRDEARDWLDDGYYVHMRYIYELSPTIAWEFDTGIYRADNKIPLQDDVVAWPVRVSIQLGVEVPEIDARVYGYAGAGWFVYDDEVVDDEWGSHFGLGSEFTGGGAFTTRLEVGHLRLYDSDVNQWTGAFLIYYKF